MTCLPLYCLLHYSIVLVYLEIIPHWFELDIHLCIKNSTFWAGRMPSELVPAWDMVWYGETICLGWHTSLAHLMRCLSRSEVSHKTCRPPLFSRTVNKIPNILCLVVWCITLVFRCELPLNLNLGMIPSTVNVFAQSSHVLFIPDCIYLSLSLHPLLMSTTLSGMENPQYNPATISK